MERTNFGSVRPVYLGLPLKVVHFNRSSLSVARTEMSLSINISCNTGIKVTSAELSSQTNRARQAEFYCHAVCT